MTPVVKDGIVLATIAIGGFVTDRPRDLRRAERTLARTAATGEVPRVTAPATSVASAFDAAISREAPTPEDARALRGMAGSELLRLYERLEDEKGSLVVPEAARLSRERRLWLHAAEHLRRHLTLPVTAGEAAKELLLAGRSVTDAALEAGFDGPNYFSRAFAEAEGVPPSRWNADGNG